MVSDCAKNSKANGILIPECPPKNDFVLTGGAAEYYMWALASHERYKATYDCLLGDPGE